MATDTGSVMRRGLFGLCLVLAGSAGGPLLHADDTEIYRTIYEPGANARPKVLILFDESGSMDTAVQERPAYDPNEPYVSQFNADRIYWTVDNTPPPADSDQWFLASSNRCSKSYTPLTETGRFASKARRWASAESAGWYALSDNVNEPVHVDCYEDYRDSIDDNGVGVANGYPHDPGNPDADDSEAYVADRGDSNLNWGNDAYTFYSAHYLDYVYDDTILVEDRDRLAIAQEVVQSLVRSNTGIDFGLATFNHNRNGENNGGRIVRRIIQGMSDEERESLVDIVAEFESAGNTPLCESTYEIYRYLAGLSVFYGLEKHPNRDTPERDLLAEDAEGNYISPNTDCAYTYVIIMTDGLPYEDRNANAAIEDLTGETCSEYEDNEGDMRANCLPEIAGYMASTDLDGDDSNGNQYGRIYTIGFHTDQQLLEDTADKGLGAYYTADSAEALTAAFQGAVLDILSTGSTYTAPAVAVDTFTRTRSRDEVFFAMFMPNAGEDWPGNIKKLKVVITDGEAELRDANNNPALDDSGQIASNATTFWSNNIAPQDGPTVTEGGVGALLAAADLGQRGQRLWTNTDEANPNPLNRLQLFSSANIDADAYGFENDAGVGGLTAQEKLLSLWQVADQDGLNEVISWGIGYDVKDEDGDGNLLDNRPWILADILHSKPLVVNYGALGEFTEDDPDLRILVGTNAGFLHMFGNDDGEEDWAFFGKELGSVLSRRMNRDFADGHIYGVDSPPVLYTRDINRDGTLDAGDGDKVWLFTGLRRGGRILYALDISDPDSRPGLLWKIDRSTLGLETPGFEELGYTWSVPVVTFIPGHFDEDTGAPRPVLIFGGGYDPNKDDHAALALGGDPDTMGRGLFIVDAEDGELLWSVTPNPNSANNMEADLDHSVAAQVTALDSNGDALTDRVYMADTGGNLWRVDLVGNALPDAQQDSWQITQLFAANGGTKATDRRFFNAPDIVRTTIAGERVDAVLLGSGDRTNPAEVDDPNDPANPAVDNQFYMIKDRQVLPYVAAVDPDRCDEDPTYDFRCDDYYPLDPNSLYPVLDFNPDDPQEVAALEARDGWALDLTENGEKSLARSLTIAGRVYFTTFTPNPEVSQVCEPEPGTGRLYIVDLFDATPVVDFDPDENDGTERSWIIGELIPDTPSAHIGSDGEIRLLLPPGEGDGGPVGNPFETGASLPDPYGSYWYREEY